ncbi:MAG TPA: metalloregulator ArsR/SmtB family transcription factor [Candidatus Deferrimicrobium sp.]|nr:metalloregulator ArsR/SmtB family transcription factor [Candidatus Deferrimicrobium sp.]
MTANAEAMTALGDPTRRAIFERLADGPLSVGTIARDLPVSRPAVSQHLRVLKHAGLVRDRPVANRRMYSLDPRGVAGLRAYFDQFWNHALGAFKAAAETLEEEKP